MHYLLCFTQHVVVRRIFRRNTLHVWVAELVIVSLMWYGFNKS